MQTDALIVLLSGAFGAAVIKMIDGLLQFALQRRAKKQDGSKKEKSDMEKRIDAIAECMMATTLDRIQYLCKVYIKDGEIDMDDRRRLHIIHEKYKGLGGNGDVDELMREVNELPLK